MPSTKIWKNYKPASKSPNPVPPRALGELAGRLKNYHHTTVVWSNVAIITGLIVLIVYSGTGKGRIDQFTLEG